MDRTHLGQLLQSRHSINGKAAFVLTVSSGANVLMVEDMKVAFFRQRCLSVPSNYTALKRTGWVLPQVLYKVRQFISVKMYQQ